MKNVCFGLLVMTVHPAFSEFASTGCDPVFSPMATQAPESATEVLLVITELSGWLNEFNVSAEVLAGTEIPAGGGRGRLYLTLHCHHHSDSCIRMGTDESHFTFH